MTNEGNEDVDAFYFNIDYRAYAKPLPADTLYFHAQYRQAAPAKAGQSLDQQRRPQVNDKKNLNGEGNYVWMEATGRGHFVGVTMSVLQNQDGWWGEGDDMFFVDGEKLPSINGTGSEDYFLGAWDFGGQPFSYALVWRAGHGRGSGGQPLVRVPLSPGFADSVYQVDYAPPLSMATRTPLGQFLLGRLLVSDRAACGVSGVAARRPDSQALCGRWTG